MLYSASDASMVLGILFQNPFLLDNRNFPISSDDFDSIAFHEVLFKGVSWLFKHGVQEIDEMIFDKFIQDYPAQLEICIDNNYLEFISTVKKLANVGNYEFHYNIVRKYSLLRSAKKMDLDITELCNENEPEETQKKKINSLSIEDILKIIQKKPQEKIDELNLKFNVSLCKETMRLGDHWEETLNAFQEAPVMGAMLQSPYMNTLYRGWQQGHFILRSGASGNGKTTLTVGDLCNVCATKYWDYKQEKFIDNPNYAGSGFMIHTEMQQKTEVQPKFISWISGIPYNEVLDGKFDSKNKERLLEAGKILYNSHIEVFYQPDFTTPKLKDIYRQCAMWGAKYCFFDYIWDNSEFGSEYKSRVSTPLRQDMVLFEIATVLKSLSEEHNIGTYSGTQLNGNENSRDILDEGCIFGSKQIKTKLDDGAIVTTLRPKEIELVDILLNRKGFEGVKKRPTHIVHNYKTRFSKYGQGVKIWQNVDLGTGRTIDIFCTDQHNQPLSVAKTIAE